MLSFGQVRISLLQFYYSNLPIYNMSFDINIKGNLDLVLFEKSLNYLLIGNKELKTNVIIINDKLVKRYNNNKLNIEIYNNNQSKNKEKEFINTVFNISNDLLIKILYLEKEKRFIFLFSDLIIDGYTIIIFFKKLSFIYDSLFNKTIIKSINNDQKILNNNKYNLDYWKKILLHQNSFDIKVKNNSNNFDENRIHFSFVNEKYKKIKNFVANNKITLFNYFTCIFQFILYIITNEKNITIDTLLGDLSEDSIGLFNDILLLPIYFNQEILKMKLKNFIEYYSKILNDIKNNRISLEYLSNKLDFFDLPNVRIHFEYSNKNTEKSIKFGNSEIISNFYENSSNQIRQLLIFNVCEFEDKIECYFSYKQECFDQEYIRLIINLFDNLLEKEDEILLNIKDFDYLQNYYDINYEKSKDKRLLCYKYAGNYPNINYSEFKKELDSF